MRPVLLILAGFAALAALLAWSRWLGGRRGPALGHLLLALVLAVVVALGWPLARLLADYRVHARERPVADVFFERIGPDRYRVAVTHLPEGRMQVVELAGDEWRLELRALEWSPVVSRLGARPRSRVDALLSRSAGSRAPALPLGVTARLAGHDGALPRAAGLGTGRGRPLLAARTLTGPWQPMAHGARFEVRLTAADTVEIDPLNAAADDSLAAR